MHLLAPIFDLTDTDITDILARLSKNKNDPVTIKIDLTEAQLAQFSERKPFFRGVSIQSKLTRSYPYDELFAHVIGYVGRINDKESKRIDKDRYAGTDLIGKIGIEDYYEDILLGQPGYQSVETDAHGNILRQLDTKPPIAGNDITLSLDYGLQTIAQQQLDGRRGAIVAIDPKNGDVLAFVSNPSYDPNPFISGISFKDYDDLREDLDQPLYNRALQGTYPPGSTIKPFEGLGGIHYGLRDWNSTIYDPGYFSLPGDTHRFRDWKRGGHGTVDLKNPSRCRSILIIISWPMRWAFSVCTIGWYALVLVRILALICLMKNQASCHHQSGRKTLTIKIGYRAKRSRLVLDKDISWQHRYRLPTLQP